MTKVAVVMGSISDWPTMKLSVDILQSFGIEVEKKIISAHRMPKELTEFAETARSQGIGVIIAGAGGAAHLPGMLAASTTLPVLGVPIQSKALNGLDSLLSIVQMPAGIPVGTLAIGTAGAKNAAYYAVQILSLSNHDLVAKIEQFRSAQTQQAQDSEEQMND
ncbi:MAG: 5-(carboxyamino)imidazole ribonucleotide mutase [Lactobacillaceae bacterium]|jgi:5-(carboxyamino)imidazole ribonucleotide mutase|nr:5-(carboxyamino)imidazole ribonucleotide mutase [Lactobacillaceae bacterium]